MSAVFCWFFQAEDGIRDALWSRGLGDVYKRQALALVLVVVGVIMSLIYLRFFRFDELIKTPRIEQ